MKNNMVYCVEDDDSIRELMLYTLNTAGFSARGFRDGTDFWKGIEDAVPAIVMLDIMLPRENGLEILQKLRQKPSTSKLPVIMATAKGTEFDKVMGLDSGADDYLVKPFGMMEMISHIKAVLRRTVSEEIIYNRMEFGGISVNDLEHMVYVENNVVQLTLKEYEILILFMKNPGRVFSREQLLAQIWGTKYIGETRTVDVHIGTLRNKLGSCGGYISTVRGVGYRMEVKN